MFIHLDAKLASALTNILEGDLARQVAIFKGQEAKEKRHARGREVLLKHGPMYDFASVQLISEDLRNFIARWDTVMNGQRRELRSIPTSS